MPATLRHGGWAGPPLGVAFGVNWKSPQAAGLLAWWPMAASYGTNVLHDMVAQAESSITAAGWAISSEFGPVLTFNNASTVISVNLAMPNLPIAFAFWVKPNAWNENGLYDTAPNAGNTLRQYKNGEVEWWDSQPKVAIGWTAGVWAHLVVVYYYDSAAGQRHLRLYRDGLLISDTGVTAADTYAWSSPKFGNINNGSAGWFDGQVADIRMYNRQLADAEVWQLYDPATRWELYHPLRRRATAFVVSGGLALVKVLSETQGLPETGLKATGFVRLIAETEAATESPARVIGFVRLVTETLGLTEAAGRLKAMARVIDDTLGISEAVGRAATYPIVVSATRVVIGTARRAIAFATGRKDVDIR